ncbi:hypothetical protein [Actinopolyspora alba]|uniref:hypothetical protein n=1 Tax=Actinopolyspora alba TaxID=673379 RepID=UPI001113CDCF|nr:hypothetical protein [Actinopolyspora alba]
MTSPHAIEACLRGSEPAEALSTTDREHLVRRCCEAGWTDAEIAARTGMTTYTTARIRTRLGLPAGCGCAEHDDTETPPDALAATGRRRLRRPTGTRGG